MRVWPMTFGRPRRSTGGGGGPGALALADGAGTCRATRDAEPCAVARHIRYGRRNKVKTDLYLRRLSQRGSRVQYRVCPGSPRCLFTGSVQYR